MLTAALGGATLAVQNSGMRLIWRTHPSTSVITLNLTQLVLDGIVILRAERSDRGDRSRTARVRGTNPGRVPDRPAA